MLPSFIFLVMAWVPSTFAASFEFRSQCSYPVDVYDNAVTCTLQPNSTGCGVTANAPWSGMFRHSSNEQATCTQSPLTLVSCHLMCLGSSGRVFHRGGESLSGTCTSLAECMRVTAKVGFNVAMSIFPIGPSRNDPMYNCQYVVCYANGCHDAYQYPSDDIKTKSCPDTTNFVVTFCPDLPP
ncbi:hypothetical protein DYB25_002002 [Aphanomyces astaci]|uniref:Secreted protein n=1 Tax=Aphanomyces astaci TaxID=112090 RepID=A0A397DKY7_APHAT|nr:hypothetical protein DYB25_002002 [Aphanomyces astaci]RHY49116.1 hypothetical protein DYB38_003853 [Aphanomyces astaci]RHY63939.1 hypothetical protein DYB30_004634 [Aphanomyces astaci]RHZ02737.1 hypothetical protein DYB26_001728 [Aphanomyces astaci]RHZ40632.1 hypothetical protein DYB31_002582 [Aphanomyces astaci]